MKIKDVVPGTIYAYIPSFPGSTETVMRMVLSVVKRGERDRHMYVLVVEVNRIIELGPFYAESYFFSPSAIGARPRGWTTISVPHDTHA